MIYVVNGPNLNLLGRREPEKYGRLTLDQMMTELKKIASDKNSEIKFFQSNSEGDIIDFLQSLPSHSKIIINPGALAHTSMALMDCITAVEADVIEVHITNIYAREDFRRHSYVSSVARGVISGLGISAYSLALAWFLERE